MVKLADRVKVLTPTVGTGTLTLGAVVSGYQSFAQGGIGNGDTVRYVIEDGANWEIGTGTYTTAGPSLTRTVLESTNSDTAISLTGTASVFLSASKTDLQHAADMNQGVATTDSPTFAGVSTTALTLGGTGVTATAAELNILDGVTATASEINLLDGKTLSGLDTTLITGTAGTAGDIVQWNADGDLVSYGAATQLQATWEAGTSTTESLVSPAKVKAEIDALRPGPYTTSIATTTGTTRDLTGIPAGVTEVDVFFKGVSHNNSDVDGDFLVQLGTTSGFVTSGYYSHSSTYAVSRTTTAGFLVLNPGALNTFQGVMRLRRIADGTQSWIAAGEGMFGGAGGVIDTWSKVITLASDLTQIRLTTEGGTSVFDAGNLSIRCRT